MSNSCLEMALKHFCSQLEYTEHEINPSIQDRVILGRAQSDLFLHNYNMVVTSKREFGINASFFRLPEFSCASFSNVMFVIQNCHIT